jgi:4-amino-4-deoxy-L-arabinose transferase-like glycosyltransferase
LGLGLLAKGPLIMVLTFPPLLSGVALEPARFKAIFQNSCVNRIIITAVIAIPWYYFAEKKHQDF